MYIPSSVFLEYELLFKSKKIQTSKIIKDILHFEALENIEEIPLDSSIILLAYNLRKKYDLTYFDSLHCASTLKADGIIVSSDSDFERIKNIKVIKPKNFI